MGITSTQLTAQKVEFETIEINYGDIAPGPSGYRSLYFKENTNVSINTIASVKSDKKEFTGTVTFSGRDLKGNTYSSKYDFGFIGGETNYKGSISIKASKENPVYISHVTLAVANNKKEIASETEAVIPTTKKTSFAILLNGIKNSEYCKEIPIDVAYSNETISSKYFAIVIGLNNTKQEPANPELAMSQGHGSSVGVFTWATGTEKTITHRVKPTADKNGNWFYNDSVPMEKGSTALLDFRIEFTTACNDTFAYAAAYKEKLTDNKYYNYRLEMEPVANDNPIFQGGTGTFNNVLGLTLPPSSISISGGSFQIKDNASFTMSFSSMNPNGNNNTNNTVIGAVLGFVDGNGKTYSYTATWNKTSELWEAKASVNGSEKSPFVVKSFFVRGIQEDKDTTVFESNGRLAQPIFGLSSLVLTTRSKTLKYNDPCDTKFKLKEIEYSETTASGMYTVQFNFSFEEKSDIPAEVAMVVELTDCKGNKEYVRITLKYDAKTNTYTGSESLAQNKECPWSLTYGEIAAYNPCKEKTVWSFETSKSKSNGSGTRNVATANNGKPGLL